MTADTTFDALAVTITDADEITPLDLRAEYAADPAAFDVYTVARYDEQTAYMGSTHDLTVLYHRENRRVGIASNSYADWADYESVHEAVDDYLNNHEMFEARN